MTVSEIYTAVRCCIDEEPVNAAHLDGASAFDFDDQTTDIGLMNTIIKNKIPAAVRWVALYAPTETLSGDTSSGSGGGGSSSTSVDIIVEETTGTGGTATINGNIITPGETLIRLVRVRGDKWERSILGDSLIKEDSDEYLQLRDDYGAQASNDRPQAALVNTKEKKIEVWPAENNTFTITYIRALTDTDMSTLVDDNTDVNLPATLETSFIYYLAYLLLSAYGDARAKGMFDIATLNLGRSEDKQRQ